MKKTIETTPKQSLGFEVIELEDERLTDVLGGCGDNCGDNCCNSSKTCISVV